MRELICNQTKIPREQWRYGLRSSAAVGCGWIAAYNALCLMGYEPEPEGIIGWFERHVPGINGNLGTFLPSVTGYFRHLGFGVKVSGKRGEFDVLVREVDVGILYYFWREGLHIGRHFAVTEWKDGRFVGYNTFRDSVGPDAYGESLSAFVKRKKYFGVALITIKDRKKHNQ